MTKMVTPFLTHLATPDPLARSQVHLLNLVLLDGHSTVVLGLLPLQAAAGVVNVGHLKGTLRLGGLTCSAKG